MGKRLFPLGDVPAGPSAIDPKAIWRSEDLESVSPGEVIAPLNDYLMVWDELETWRHEGDPLSDDVVRALNLRPGQDGLQKIQDHLELPEEEQVECIKLFWAEVAREPPEGITAFPPNPYSPSTSTSSSSPSSIPSHLARPAHSIRSPNYNPPPTVAEGQAVFWRYSSQIFMSLLHFSLAGGFSANRVVNVLRETNYLTGKERDSTYKRLLETTQAIMDYMGWKSAIRVRLLHSSVRVRLASKMGALNVYDNKVDGIPINQEDLITTLGSFAIAPLWSLRRLGVTLSPSEELAYIAVWRHIGYYLGISPTRLQLYYNDVTPASKLFISNTMHLLNIDSITDDYRSTSTYRLLSAVANRPPRYAPVEQSLALSRFLLGDGLADRLVIPPTASWRKARMQIMFALERYMNWFGRKYSKRWEVERVEMTRMLLLMVVCWQLGVRRTKFTVKAFMADGAGQGIVTGRGTDEKNDHANGPGTKADSAETEIEKVTNPDDDELDPEVVMGPAAGKAIVGRWKWLIGEMVVVTLGVGIGVLGSSWVGYRLVRP